MGIQQGYLTQNWGLCSDGENDASELEDSQDTQDHGAESEGGGNGTESGQLTRR